MNHKIKQENLKTYLFGGNADFILKDTRNNDYINYNIVKYPNDIFRVYHKSAKKTYIGNIIGKIFTILDKEASNDIATIFSKFHYILIYTDKLPSNIDVYYTGKCSVCNRTLKNPKYIDIGIGIECLKKF